MGKYNSELLMLFNLAFLMKCKYFMLYHIMKLVTTMLIYQNACTGIYFEKVLNNLLFFSSETGHSK